MLGVPNLCDCGSLGVRQRAVASRMRFGLGACPRPDPSELPRRRAVEEA